MPLSKHKIVFIVGPTAAGKTEVGLRLAQLVPCEFVSADSMQIYKGMDIVTDKLPKVLRRRHPYHLVDIIGPTGNFNAADFCRRAESAIRRILKKRKLPVVIGGTGLYVNSLLYGIFEGGPKDEKIRRRLESEARKDGVERLYERLKKVDPEAAARINVHDKRRIIRALEVYESTQSPISFLQKERRGLALAGRYTVYLFGLRRPREELYRRIEQRVDFMVNAGLLDEVRSLLKRRLSPTAYFCIGIRETEGFLKGAYDFSEAVRLIKINSRHFAKRQMTWFNRNKDIEWFDIKEGEDLSAVARKIFERVR